jgi:SAM-dependent methyltransferase
MSDLTFTGERFLPGCAGEIAYEHWHRYAFARRFVAGRRVLDAACGEGYGASLLAAAAASVVGVDIDAATVAHARAQYAKVERLRFVEGSCAGLPLPDAAVDVVVSFETVEHLPAADQPRMVAEFARVLVPGGLLVISSPNRRAYSDDRQYANAFHQHELYRDEFAALLTPAFPAQHWYHQRVATWSGIWSEGAADGAEAWLGGERGVAPYAAGDGMYFIVVAARSAAALPAPATRVSLFTDADDSEGKRAAANAREVLRLDALLLESNAGLARQGEWIVQLERLVAERDAALAELQRERETLRHARDAALRRVADGEQKIVALDAEIARLHAEVLRQQTLVSDRQSFRWWLRLPWFRLSLWRGRSR